MITVTHSHQVLIRAPLQTVFEYISDLTRHPDWNDGLKIEALAPGPVMVGKEYTSYGAVAVQKERPNIVRVSQYNPPHEYGFIARDPNFGDVLHVFKFKTHNEGTLITRTMTVQLNPIVALVFRFLIYPLIGGPSMERSFATLKETFKKQK